MGDSFEDGENVQLGRSVSPMWAEMVPKPGENVVQPAPGSLAALCEERPYEEIEAEHNNSKCLLVKHIWDRHETRFHLRSCL